MFDKELLKKVEEKCGSYWTGGVSDEIIKQFCNKLQVELPNSYIEFLKKYGEGGAGFYISGIKHESYSSAEDDTLLYREKNNINKKWIVISDISTEWEEYIVCLDTTRMKDGECPIIKYDLTDNEEEEFKNNFYEYFNYKLELKYNE